MINIKILGVVTEYNPFHNGHKYHLEKSKQESECDYSIAVMSGNFLQRGEPALVDKWTRAKMAISSGVDLVIELPTLFACNSAEFFAYGSTYILDALGIVDSLCFGSESGDIDWLLKLANILAKESTDYKEYLSIYLDEGNNFPKARELALIKLIGDSYPIAAPNNILGLEYIKSLIQLDSSIKPVTIKRINAEYNSTDITSEICSATAIRHLLKDDIDSSQLIEVMPKSSYTILTEAMDIGSSPVFIENYEQILLYKIRSSTPEQLRTIHDVREGLEHRIIKAGNISNNYKELLDNIKTKRYTETSIKRILIKILLDITQSDVKIKGNRVAPKYVRVLAFNKKGASILKKLKKTSSLPIITNLKQYRPIDSLAKSQIELDIKATNIYNLGLSNPSLRNAGDDFTITPRLLE